MIVNLLGLPLSSYNSTKNRTQQFFYALNEYNKLIELNKVFFDKDSTWDGLNTDYEIALISPSDNGGGIKYFRNELGAKVLIKPTGDFVIRKINPYYMEETFKYKNKDVKYTFRTFVKDFIVNNQLTKSISTINLKFVGRLI